MPGRGPEIGQSVIDEFIRATLSWQFGEVKTTAVPVALETNWTIYAMGFPVVKGHLACRMPSPRIRHLSVIADAPPLRQLGLEIPVTLGEGGEAAHVKPVLRRMPIFGEKPLTWHQITFEGIRKPRTRFWAIPPKPKVLSRGTQFERLTAKPRQLVIPSSQHVSQRRLAFGFERLGTRPFPGKYFVLPIIKTSVPLSRFGSELTIKFRKALAEKGQTSLTNTRVTLVYDRMNMALFTSLSQDSRGNMVCIPKSELVGKNHPHWGRSVPQSLNKGIASAATFYLVFGQRLDNQAPLRALVPVTAAELDGQTADQEGKSR
jgi:hypothetical protein